MTQQNNDKNIDQNSGGTFDKNDPNYTGKDANAQGKDGYRGTGDERDGFATGAQGDRDRDAQYTGKDKLGGGNVPASER